jgi:hypothetical protein
MYAFVVMMIFGQSLDVITSMIGEKNEKMMFEN